MKSNKKTSKDIKVSPEMVSEFFYEFKAEFENLKANDNGQITYEKDELVAFIKNKFMEEIAKELPDEIIREVLDAMEEAEKEAGE
jgi:hypothetical protein